MSDEEWKAKWEAAQKALEEKRDTELVARYRHFEDLAMRMLASNWPLQPGESCTFDRDEVRHMAEMLLLLDIARGSPSVRFEPRYGGYYGEGEK